MSQRTFRNVLVVAAACLVVAASEQVQAQQVSTGGRTSTGTTGMTGGGSTAGAITGAGAGGTTQGLTGLTTQGLASDGATTGGTAGNNAAATFVGGNNTGGFVGGAREATAGGAANRQFRAITDSGVGGVNQQQQQSGTPRRVPVALRVGFTAPTFNQLPAGSLAAANDISVQRFANLRPQLAGINVSVSPTGVVTLSGSAPDVATSRLAANLLRLQPGVRSIQNQVQVEAR